MVRAARLSVAVLLSLRVAAQTPDVEGLSAPDWRARNAAATRLWDAAASLPPAAIDALWGVADSADDFDWAAPNVRGEARAAGGALAVLAPVELPVALVDFVPHAARDLVVGFSPQVLAALVLQRVGRVPSRERMLLAIELATNSRTTPGFEVLCDLVATMGTAAADELRARLASPDPRWAARRPSLAMARVLVRLGEPGVEALRGLLAPTAPVPGQRSALLAFGEFEAERTAADLAAFARLVRVREEVADEALGALRRREREDAMGGAAREFAAGCRAPAPAERRRCLAALAHLRLGGAASAVAASACGQALAVADGDEVPLAIGALACHVRAGVPEDVRERLLAIAAEPATESGRRARSCLFAAADTDPAVLAALLADGEGLAREVVARALWSISHLLGNEPLREACTAAAFGELRRLAPPEQAAFVRALASPALPRVFRGLKALVQGELESRDAARVDAGAAIAATFAVELPTLAPVLDRLVDAEEGASEAVRSAWIHFHPEALPDAVRGQRVPRPAPWTSQAFAGRMDHAAVARLLTSGRAAVREDAAAWLASDPVPAARWLAELAAGADLRLGLWGLNGLRRAAPALQADAAACDELERILRAGPAGDPKLWTVLSVTAALSAIHRLQPADLEPVLAYVWRFEPGGQWNSAVGGEPDITRLVKPWTQWGVFRAVEQSGATPAVLRLLEEYGGEGAPQKAAANDLGRACRLLRGKLVLR